MNDTYYLFQDLRLVRDKFTHVSRGFAFVHFYTVCISCRCAFLCKCFFKLYAWSQLEGMMNTLSFDTVGQILCKLNKKEGLEFFHLAKEQWEGWFSLFLGNGKFHVVPCQHSNLEEKLICVAYSSGEGGLHFLGQSKLLGVVWELGVASSFTK